MTKTITIHLECDERLKENAWTAFIDEGEYKNMLVAASTVGEAVREIGVSIWVLEQYLQSQKPNT